MHTPYITLTLLRTTVSGSCGSINMLPLPLADEAVPDDGLVVADDDDGDGASHFDANVDGGLSLLLSSSNGEILPPAIAKAGRSLRPIREGIEEAIGSNNWARAFTQ